MCGDGPESTDPLTLEDRNIVVLMCCSRPIAPHAMRDTNLARPVCHRQADLRCFAEEVGRAAAEAAGAAAANSSAWTPAQAPACTTTSTLVLQLIRLCPTSTVIVDRDRMPVAL